MTGSNKVVRNTIRSCYSANPEMRIHSMLQASRSNGPGTRFVVWFQGCSRNCSGCFNPAAQDPTAGVSVTASELAARIYNHRHLIEGITVSGGEPFEQPEGLLALLTCVRRQSSLSVLIFSGLTVQEIRRLEAGPEILDLIDVLIDGPFDRAQRLKRGLRGSKNQQIHLMSGRYGLSDIECVPDGELIIRSNGIVESTGVNALDG